MEFKPSQSTEMEHSGKQRNERKRSGKGTTAVRAKVWEQRCLWASTGLARVGRGAQETELETFRRGRGFPGCLVQSHLTDKEMGSQRS